MSLVAGDKLGPFSIWETGRPITYTTARAGFEEDLT
jgi:hypothetical protein